MAQIARRTAAAVRRWSVTLRACVDLLPRLTVHETALRNGRVPSWFRWFRDPHVW